MYTETISSYSHFLKSIIESSGSLYIFRYITANYNVIGSFAFLYNKKPMKMDAILCVFF